MKKVKHRERVTCQSHKLIRGRTKVRHTLTGFDTSGKNASLGTAKWGLLQKMSMAHLLPVELNRQSRCGVLCRQEVPVYSADRKSFLSQGHFSQRNSV